MTPVGYAHLVEHFAADATLRPLRHHSFTGGTRATLVEAAGSCREIYPPVYHPGTDAAVPHLIFALKHEPLRLDVLKAVLERLPATELEAAVHDRPTSAWMRRLGFLSEWLTGRTIEVPASVRGAYVDVIDPERFVADAKPRNVTKWALRNNLPGTSAFCPIVRRTAAVETLNTAPWAQRVGAVLGSVPEELLQRAVNYLYGRETKSTWEIEGENLPQQRGERFIHALTHVGGDPDLLAEKNLVALQT